ncbi:MAG: transcriptional repressor [Clostridia bacterium]|nr:transcriptional repressor [Clostridia bacterium]
MGYSKQRELVKAIVASSCAHPSATDIYLEARKTIPDISLGTVYRNLSLLSQSGEILRIPVDKGDRFDKTTCCHAHFCCVKCGRVFDVPTDGMAALADRICDHGHDVKRTTLLFEGVCKSCAKSDE